MSPSRDERGETSVFAGYCFGMTGENNIVDSKGNESRVGPNGQLLWLISTNVNQNY